MVLLKVLSWILRRRSGFLLLGLMAISAQLIGQSLVGTGSQPFAVAVNPATNKIYVVNNGPGTVTIIDGATNTTETERVGGTPVAIAVNPVTNKAYVAGSDGTVTVINEGQSITKRIRVDPESPGHRCQSTNEQDLRRRCQRQHRLRIQPEWQRQRHRRNDRYANEPIDTRREKSFCHRS